MFFFPLQKQSPTNYIDSLQNKRECLEKILHENEGITLHPNHFLLTGVREKLIHTLIAQRSYTESEDEACNLLKYQVEMFKKVADVMGLVDLPRHSTLKSEKVQFKEFAFDSLFWLPQGKIVSQKMAQTCNIFNPLAVYVCF